LKFDPFFSEHTEIPIVTSFMRANFTATQTVKLTVPQLGIPLQHYLRQPQRLIYALVEPNRLEVLADDVFRLKMKPLSLMSLSVQPTVDLKIWHDSSGTVHLRSRNCEILGVDYINQRFHLDLVGQLAVVGDPQRSLLEGIAELKVQVELPPPLSFTPLPLLQATGDNLLKSVLLTIKQRLMHQLLQDYKTWAEKTQACLLDPDCLDKQPYPDPVDGIPNL
jgi:hypothetical protein